MEATLAILMVLGIFVGIPAAIGFAIAGVYILGTRRRAVRGARGKALGEQPAEIGGEALLKRA
jgi:hypothetical protein